MEIVTPDCVYLPLHREFNFTFDLAATPQNTKCPLFYSEAENALVQPWLTLNQGHVNWNNPPYSRRVGEWVEKANEEMGKGAFTVQLLNANTESWWFHDVAVPWCPEIRLLRWRVPFIKDGIQLTGGYHPSVVLIWDPRRTPPPRERYEEGNPRDQFNRFSYVSI